jgi:hypothetical protein
VNSQELHAIEDEVERFDRLILASENWSPFYAKDAITHAKLIRTEAKLRRVTRKFFREQATKAKKFVNWDEYKAAVKAYQIDVLVNDVALDEMNNTFIKIAFDPIAQAVSLGTIAAQNIYGRPIASDTTTALVQQLARDQIARLVGKLVKPDGSVVDNPKAGYSISSVTRDDIRQSLHTSISMGETIQEATDRIAQTINDPMRAELIAQTETVNAYQGGLLKAGQNSGAVGKEWHDLGAEDVCADNTDDGPIPIDAQFPSGDDAPTAHPRCRCGMRLIYQEEADREGYDL